MHKSGHFQRSSNTSDTKVSIREISIFRDLCNRLGFWFLSNPNFLFFIFYFCKAILVIMGNLDFIQILLLNIQ